jgi:hypothetical protein
MGRYYFHVQGSRTTRDEMGSELPDESAAHEWAKREVRFQASQSIKESASIALDDQIVIEDETGNEVGTVVFGDVITASG